MDALFQCPLGPIFIILNFPKKILVKAEIKQLSPKKKSQPDGLIQPPPRSFRVNAVIDFLF